jgi:hypothetical protein
VLISACASSTMNAFGCHSRLAATAFLFNSVIQGKRSIYSLRFVKINAIGTPFRHLSNTMSKYKGNCNTRMRDVMTQYTGPCTLASDLLGETPGVSLVVLKRDRKAEWKHVSKEGNLRQVGNCTYGWLVQMWHPARRHFRVHVPTSSGTGIGSEFL